jgi:hypothetical protein
LKDKKLAAKIKELKTEKGEKLRKALVAAAKKRFTALSKGVLDAAQLF